GTAVLHRDGATRRSGSTSRRPPRRRRDVRPRPAPPSVSAPSGATQPGGNPTIRRGHRRARGCVLAYGGSSRLKGRSVLQRVLAALLCLLGLAAIGLGIASAT